jgi:hypothetical protein
MIDYTGPLRTPDSRLRSCEARGPTRPPEGAAAPKEANPRGNPGPRLALPSMKLFQQEG